MEAEWRDCFKENVFFVRHDLLPLFYPLSIVWVFARAAFIGKASVQFFEGILFGYRKQTRDLTTKEHEGKSLCKHTLARPLQPRADFERIMSVIASVAKQSPE